MREQVALQRILQAKYEELRSRNPQYSRRAFSRRLGLSAGAMSELFNGRRKVTIRLAERIADGLGLDPQERMELFSLFPETSRRSLKTHEFDASPAYLQLSADQFRVISDWYHFAVLALMRTRGFRSDIPWIANRLGLGVKLVRGTVERLKRLRIVEEDEKGELKRLGIRFRTSDDVTCTSVRSAHSQYLDFARNALETLSVEERDFTSIMLTMSPGQLPRAKEMVRKFQDELSAEMESKPQSEVYQLCIQLFPLTKIQSEGKQK